MICFNWCFRWKFFSRKNWSKGFWDIQNIRCYRQPSYLFLNGKVNTTGNRFSWNTSCPYWHFIVHLSHFYKAYCLFVSQHDKWFLIEVLSENSITSLIMVNYWRIGGLKMKSNRRISDTVVGMKETFWIKGSPIPPKLKHVCKCWFITLCPSYALLVSVTHIVFNIIVHRTGVSGIQHRHVKEDLN